MSMKFFIYAGGRWREVDIDSGVVSGWGRARFVYQRRGKLRAASSDAVLRGVRALAAGQPTTVRDGARLSHIRQSASETRALPATPAADHCCQQCHNNVKQVEATPRVVSAHTQTQEHTQTSKTITNKRKHVITSSDSEHDRIKITKVQIESVKSRVRFNNDNTHKTKTSESAKSDISPKPNKQKTVELSPTKTKQNSVEISPIKTKQKTTNSRVKLSPDEFISKITSRSVDESRRRSQVNGHRTPRSDICKELVIDEDDVGLIRKYLQKHCSAAVLRRYDSDEAYKALVFYRINPLVSVERYDISSYLEDQISLADFASQLGLRSVSEASRERRYKTRRSAGTQNEPEKTDLKRSSSIRKLTERILQRTAENNNNVVKTKATKKGERTSLPKKTERDRDTDHSDSDSVVLNKKSKRVNGSVVLERDAASDSVKCDRDGDSARVQVSATPTRGGTIATSISKKPCRANVKEYSSLEDHAIVSWLSSGQRSSRVNGNAVWRELQDSYCNITGTQRSWHSLRNRYLRYILPSLSHLALPPSLAHRLRAAAHTGSLKARKLQRRNSLLEKQSSVRGAWSRRPHAVSEEPSSLSSRLSSRDSSPARVVVTPHEPRASPRTVTSRTSPHNVTSQTSKTSRASQASLTSPSLLPRPRRSVTSQAPRTRKLYNPNTVL